MEFDPVDDLPRLLRSIHSGRILDANCYTCISGKGKTDVTKRYISEAQFHHRKKNSS